MILRTCLTALLGYASAAPALAADFLWSDTQLQALYGTRYREPFNAQDVSKGIVTLQHANAWSLGKNFAFVDMLQSDSRDGSASEYYGEWYGSLSLAALRGQKPSGGFLRDVYLTMGINYGSKSSGANPRVLLPGVSVDFNLPGFAFFNVDLLAYLDRGRFDGQADGGNDENSWQVTPAGKYPFAFGEHRFSVEGFVDFIGSHGAKQEQILTQTQLRWDVGHYLGHTGKVEAGLEYQYWKNKYGFDGVNESLSQLLLSWRF